MRDEYNQLSRHGQVINLPNESVIVFFISSVHTRKLQVVLSGIPCFSIHFTSARSTLFPSSISRLLGHPPPTPIPHSTKLPTKRSGAVFRHLCYKSQVTGHRLQVTCASLWSIKSLTALESCLDGVPEPIFFMTCRHAGRWWWYVACVWLLFLLQLQISRVPISTAGRLRRLARSKWEMSRNEHEVGLETNIPSKLSITVTSDWRMAVLYPWRLSLFCLFMSYLSSSSLLRVQISW